MVTGLIRDSLPPPLCALTIWRSPGAHRYVERVLALPRGEAHSIYYLLVDHHDEAAGAAAFGRSGPNAFLNYIAVSSSCRGRSRGRLLLRRAATDFLAERQAEKVLLDVDPTNSIAYRWYRRLGFATYSETFWQLGTIRDGGGEAGAILDGPDADAMHGEFGFSRLRVKTALRIHEVGRLGRSYFRLDELAWRDPGVHAALRRLDARRRVLLMASKPRWHLTTVHHSLRLGTDADVLCERLRDPGALATLASALSTEAP